MPALESRTITIWIDKAPRDVYDFAANPENLPIWATGLADGVWKAGDEWKANSPSGVVTLQFTPPNAHGILDHRVILPTGETVEVPMRVITNGTGSEVQFTLFRQPGMSESQFAADAAWVERDLQTLKRVLES